MIYGQKKQRNNLHFYICNFLERTSVCVSYQLKLAVLKYSSLLLARSNVKRFWCFLFFVVLENFSIKMFCCNMPYSE